jgi:uncharacterized repeat protein (TIGR01451 family)
MNFPLAKKWLSFTVIVSIMISLLGPVAVNAANWGTAQVIDGYTGYNSYHDVAVSGDLTVAVWLKTLDNNTWHVWASRSEDGGVTWEAEFQVDDNLGDCSSPQIAISDSNIVIVYTKDSRVHSSGSTDGGDSWQPAGPIDTGGNCFLPQVAISGGHTVALWECDSKTIYSNHSADFGVTWDGAGRRDTLGDWVSNPRVAMSGLNVAAVWEQGNNVYFVRSTNGGLDWSAPILIGGSGLAVWPEVAISEDNVVAVWAEDFPKEIYFNHSADAGLSWDGSSPLGNPAGSDNFEPKIAMSGLNAVAVWYLYDGSDYIAHYNHSADGGATWLAGSLPLTGAGGIGPYVAMSGNTAVAVWDHEFLVSSDPEVWGDEAYARSSTDGGASWGAEQYIDANSLDIENNPIAAVSASTAVVVWCKPAVSGEDPRVYSVTITVLPDINLTKTATLTDDDGDGAAGPGDTLSYTVVIENAGTGDATGVVFQDTPDPNTRLVVGSVTTTGEFVSKGNISGDTIEVIIGTMVAPSKVTVKFDVTISSPLWISQVSNQGVVNGANFASVKSDDPTTAAPADPTVTLIKSSPPVHGPAMSYWGIIAFNTMLGTGVFLMVTRRRKVAGKKKIN